MILQKTCFTMCSLDNTQQTSSLLKAASKGLVAGWVFALYVLEKSCVER